ncbi:hypothetical protein ACLBKS_03190 [Hylemonella sp. W303a]|uniref:hypothetical protein n=1 Tax=Hylemonella sp. W303a TaxID=3389873 RepID=UPI00396AF765
MPHSSSGLLTDSPSAYTGIPFDDVAKKYGYTPSKKEEVVKPPQQFLTHPLFGVHHHSFHWNMLSKVFAGFQNMDVPPPVWVAKQYLNLPGPPTSIKEVGWTAAAYATVYAHNLIHEGKSSSKKPTS